MKLKPGFVPALLTPVDANGHLDEASYRKQIEDMIQAGAVGLLALGSMGKQAFLCQSTCVEAARVAGGVQVVFSDTGIGIAPEHLPLITQKFYQAAPSAGAGIGLALAVDILRLHGGRLDIDSEPGVGTTVTVWLPLGSGK